VLLLVSTAVLFSALGLLWTMVLRESARRNLLLEYEAFRASSAVVDEYRRDQSFTTQNDEKILGFGFYEFDGTAFKRYGTAPERIDVSQERWRNRLEDVGTALPGGIAVRFSQGEKSLILIRYSGFQNAGRGSGMMAPGGRMQRGWSGSPLLQSPGKDSLGQPFPTAMSGNYLVWMEYSSSDLGTRLGYTVAAGVISLILIVLFLILIVMFRHNESLRTREAQTRELVQLGEAARTLVHEIKNPLGIMRIQTSAIRKAASGQVNRMERLALDGDEDNGRRGSSGRIIRSSELIEGEIQRLSALADRIREFLQPGQATLEDLELKPFLESFCDRYNNAGNSEVYIKISLPLDTVVVRTDKEKLLTALDNLVRNAMDAVEGLAEDEKAISLRLFRREGFWVIAVADNGRGISPENAKRLFDPFFTTKEKGSGIGLALSKRMIESFGALLAYEGSNEGRGAVFSISLPVLSD